MMANTINLSELAEQINEGSAFLLIVRLGSIADIAKSTERVLKKQQVVPDRKGRLLFTPVLRRMLRAPLRQTTKRHERRRDSSGAALFRPRHLAPAATALQVPLNRTLYIPFSACQRQPN
ncbi:MULTISPECIES: hypothetical protein [Pseudomonas]|uniref:hypothetical protein n=1 Tax=Pseudomonas TaxID=286 RepID=UPI0012E12E44|nr:MULTISPECIES: hypothetical protein [Pseudomonas]MBA6104622.1 hypothetical protein [Pseudomonas monteilii]